MSFKTHETKGRRRILYAGCGTGSAAIGMAQRESGTCNVVGIDNSRELIELAKHDREHKAFGEYRIYAKPIWRHMLIQSMPST